MKEFIKKYYIYIGIGLVTVVSLILASIPSETPVEFTPNIVNETPEKEEYIYVDIKGSISNPGVYKVRNNTRLFQLINLAGGLTLDANNLAINQSILLIDEQIIYIPNINDDVQDVTVIQEPDETDDLININRANKSELETLPGIGPTTAQKIIDYREENNGFEVVENIMDVPGIGESTFNEIKDLITT